MKEIPIIDQAKCNLCRRCVKDCVRGVLSVQEKRLCITGDGCILCSHCQAVCPEGAISFDPAILKNVSFKSFPYEEKFVGPENADSQMLVNLIRSRRSIRKYKKKKVPDKVLDDLVSCAVTAPSGSNCQVWEFTILNGRDKVWDLAGRIGAYFERLNRMAKNPIIRTISPLFAGMELINYYRDRLEGVENALAEASKGNDLLFWGAPALVIVHSTMEASMPIEDAQYASYNMTLLAHAFGLGTCYIGYASASINRAKDVKEYLGIPQKNRVHAVLTLGYTDVEYCRLPLRKPVSVSKI